MHHFSKYPLLKQTPAFVCGCLLPTIDLFSIDLLWPLLVAVFSLGCILYFKKSKKSTLAILYCVSFFALGTAITISKQPRLSDTDYYSAISTLDSTVVLIGTPDGSPTTAPYGEKMFFNLQYFRLKGTTKPTSGRILVHIKSDTSPVWPRPGGLYALRIQLRMPNPASIPGGFDWKNHLKKKGVYHEGWVRQSEVLKLKSPDGIYALSNSCKDYVEKLLFDRIRDEADLGVASALLMGNENWLDSETENNFAAAGVLHVLCVSGMHLVLLYGILIKLFKPLLRKRPGANHIVFPVLVGTIWFYSLITGMSPSITRAATMTTFVILSEWLGRRVDKTNLMCASMILLCCLDPLMLLSVGFQLSFLAVCGIFYLHPIILSAIEPSSKLTRQIWEMTSVTLAAQLATFPLSLYLFGQFPNWFLLANMVIVPVSSIVMYAGMILVMVGNIPWIGEWVGLSTSLSIKLLRYLVELISSLPYAVTDNIYYPILMTITVYVSLAFLFNFFKRNTYNSLIALLTATITCLASFLFSNQDFAKEDSCWILKSKSRVIIVKQKGLNAEILAFQGASEKELMRIENTLATKRNVQVIKRTIINQNINFRLNQYQMTLIHRFPKKWNQNEVNLKYLKKTRILALYSQPNDAFWDDLEKTIPNLKRLVFLKKVYLNDKSRVKAESLGIQISNLDELGYIHLESKLIQ